jgi:hypothetical protein
MPCALAATDIAAPNQALQSPAKIRKLFVECADRSSVFLSFSLFVSPARDNPFATSRAY